MPLRLTAIVPTAGRWDHVETVVRLLLPAVDELGLEIIAVCGGGSAAPPMDRQGVRYAAIPEPDVFAARAAGVMLATGDVVALLEDHALPDGDWARTVLAAWEAQPGIDALVHTIVASPEAGIWELAQFMLTFGPFLGVTEAPRDRLPSPGLVSFRRSLLPATTPPAGWMEYELLGELVAGGRIAMTTATAPVHVQPVGWKAPLLSFHSGRMFAGSRAQDRAVSRRTELRRLRRETATMLSQTLAARRRVNAGVLGPRFTGCAVMLVAAHVAGQLVGVATRSVGRSAAGLE